MSRLDKLISELCPDGVEYKRIEDIATEIYRGSGIKRDDVVEDGIPCVRYGEIYTTYGIWFDKCASHTRLEKVQSPKYFEYGDILFVITGESVEDIAKSTAYIGHEKCLAGGDIVVLKHNQDPKFISYALATTNARKQKSAGKVKSKVVHSSVPSIAGIVIPIPPLPVQREIVRILDNFTELTAELTAELIARKKQYEYYRDSILTFKALHMSRLEELITELCPDGVPFVDLGKVCEIRSGWGFPNAEQGQKSGEYPFYKVSDMNNSGNELYMVNSNNYIDFDVVTKLKCNPAPQGTIIFPKIGAAIGTNKKRILTCPACYDNNVMGLIVNEDKITSKYLYYIMAMVSLTSFADYSGAMPSIRKTTIEKYKIPVPPLPVQREIIRILDNFTELTAELATELTARQKQYEYYRDILLTFKKSR